MEFDTHKPMNQCQWTGFEKDSSHKVPDAYKVFGVKMFTDNFGCYRFVIEGKAGLLLDKHKFIEAENVVPEFQGQHYMKGLVAVAQQVLGVVKSSGNQTEERRKYNA